MSPVFTLAPPTNVTSTTDVQVCTQYGGFGVGLACKALLPQGRLALVWNWKAQPVRVSGFHIYRVDGYGGRLLVGTQANGPNSTAWVVDPPPPDGYAGACYAVTVYGSGQESPLSAPYCGGPGATVQTISLKPTTLRSSSVNGGSGAAQYDPSYAGETLVGYSYATQKGNVTGDISWNAAFRAALLFDVTPVLHRKIIAARLHLTVMQTWDWSGGSTMPGAPTGSLSRTTR